MNSKKTNMKLIRTFLTMLALVPFLLISCQDDQKRDQNVEILESDEIETDVGNSEAPEGREGEDNSLYGSILEDQDLTSYAEALEASGAEENFTGNGPYTVFAPSNKAFEALSAEERERLQDPNYKEQNRKLWKYYMVDGKMTADYFSKKLEVGEGPWTVTTLNGENLEISLDGEDLLVEDARGNRARVERTVEAASDGVLHVTNQVLSPSGGLIGSEVEVDSEVQAESEY